MMSRGWPWVATSLTGTIATPMPWVKMTRSLTQPVAFGFFVEVELADRQHHLAGVVAERVAVGVDVDEVVVLADRLELVERVAERPVVPQPGVEERRLRAP